jgi:hypothetical protein
MAVVVSVCKGAVIGNIGSIVIQEAGETHAYSYFQVNRPHSRGARPCMRVNLTLKGRLETASTQTKPTLMG